MTWFVRCAASTHPSLRLRVTWLHFLNQIHILHVWPALRISCLMVPLSASSHVSCYNHLLHTQPCSSLLCWVTTTRSTTVSINAVIDSENTAWRSSHRRLWTGWRRRRRRSGPKGETWEARVVPTELVPCCTPVGGVNRRRYGGWSPWTLVKIKLVQPSLSQHDTRAEPESTSAASLPGFHYNALLYSSDMMHSGPVACSGEQQASARARFQRAEPQFQQSPWKFLHFSQEKL